MSTGKFLNSWAQTVLADPITKQLVTIDRFQIENGVVDARVYLQNSSGFGDWEMGQKKYESWEQNADGYKPSDYKKEIDRDKATYKHFKLSGAILDIGGGVGTVREFLEDSSKFLSVDPFINAPFLIPEPKRTTYRCLSEHLNFIAGMAEFLPITSASFDWVHMRSMLDHVQIPDLALIEAARVLRPGGNLLIGMLVEGGKKGDPSGFESLKELVKHGLSALGISRFRDYHTWHPTLKNLRALISAHGFEIEEEYWQPGWNDNVVYIKAVKRIK